MGFADLVRCVKIAPLFACIGLAASLAGPLGRAEAINATWSGLVDTILFDCPGLPPPDINCGSTQVIPGTPVIDKVLTLSKQTDITYFVVSSLTAFTDVGSTTISSQGVAQVDVLRTPTSGNFFDGGEVVYQLTFDAPEFPLVLDLSGSMHRSGPDWGFLVGPGGVDLDRFGPPEESVQVPTLSFPTAGDYTFHVHTMIPANSGTVRMSVLAADLVAPPTDQTTGETRVVWNLQVTPIPWSATLLLILVGGSGLLLCSFPFSSANRPRHWNGQSKE